MWLIVQCPGSDRFKKVRKQPRVSVYRPCNPLKQVSPTLCPYPPTLKGFRTFTICIILDIVEVYTTAPPVFLQQVTLSATQVDLTAL